MMPILRSISRQCHQSLSIHDQCLPFLNCQISLWASCFCNWRCCYHWCHGHSWNIVVGDARDDAVWVFNVEAWDKAKFDKFSSVNSLGMIDFNALVALCCNASFQVVTKIVYGCHNLNRFFLAFCFPCWGSVLLTWGQWFGWWQHYVTSWIYWSEGCSWSYIIAGVDGYQWLQFEMNDIVQHVQWWAVAYYSYLPPNFILIVPKIRYIHTQAESASNYGKGM